MGRFVLRRLAQGVVTIFSVMVVTFLLFRGVAGDISSAYVGQRATAQQRAEWLHRYGYDLPLLVNIHSRMQILDEAKGDQPLSAHGAEELGLILLSDQEGDAAVPIKAMAGRYVRQLSEKTPLDEMTGGKSARLASPELTLGLSDGGQLKVDLSGASTCGEIIRRINEHPDNGGRVRAEVHPWHVRDLADSQFVHHLHDSASFQARSLKTNETLTSIIAERAPKSLALMVPAMALGWLLAMVVSCFVAYYRDTWIDEVGVLLSVLGMCVPFLAFMIVGQWVMFQLAPTYAYGLGNRANIYVPIVIMVIAGLGGEVRFYRTVFLDEVNRDYVRTARAKGVPLPGILFKHVLKNCMLPILTSLVLEIPFLMMGSLLVESYFGIPGLGDLLLSSINGRDEPIMSALVFLTAAIYTVGVLITDLSYAVFDPRIRLR